MKIVLCLSGGGFRASLFHLGVLKAIRELDRLRDIVMISAASGGSVTAAAFQQCIDTRKKINASGMKYLERTWRFDEFEARLLQVTKAGALSAYTRSVALILCFWSAIIAVLLLLVARLAPVVDYLPDWLSAGLAGIAIAATGAGILIYMFLLPSAYRYATARRDLARRVKKYGIADPFGTLRSPFAQAITYPWMPRTMRCATLDDKLYKHEMLGVLDQWPLMCLAAVELNRGREMIFSQRVLSELGPIGSVALWEHAARHGESNLWALENFGYPFRFSYDASTLPIAEAVAASSAYPPFFPPVRVRNNRDANALIGDFIDGGVLDNAAVNAPLEMLLHLAKERGRYADPLRAHVSFEELASDLLVANAGAVTFSQPEAWSLFGGLRRTVDILAGHQETLVDVTLGLVRRLGNPNVRAISHRAGFPVGSVFESEGLRQAISRIRTHFDAFDSVETATLVYLGYIWTREVLEAPTTAAKSFETICKEVTGSDEVSRMTPQALERHLTFSSKRMAVSRALGRWIANWMTFA